MENSSISLINQIKELKDGDTLSFEKKEYHLFKESSEHKVYHMTNTDSFVRPDKYFGILIEDKNDITLDGNGATFVIHGDMCALALVRCNNVKLKNFTIRYNSPTNFEMKVDSIKGNKIVYSIPKNTEFEVNNNDITFLEKSPLTGETYYSYTNNKNCYCNVIHRGEEVFRTQKSPIKPAIKIKKISDTQVECSYIFKPKFMLGDVVALSQNWCRDNCGMFFWECSNIESTDLEINYMHGFGWLAQMCENLTYTNIKFQAADGYVVSSFADLIHVCGCKGYVNIDNCFFTHPHDDGINIHGAFLRLKEKIDANTGVFEFVHKQQGGYKNFFSGNKVKFYHRNNLEEFDGVYTVKDTEDYIDDKLVKITFEEELPSMKVRETVIENITYNPQVTIKNCIFKAIPTRGILCTTDKESEICYNEFESLKMPDIFISCDCRDWYESGPCRNMKIHHNKFSQKDPILFKPIAAIKPVDNVHRNIEIFDNE